MTTFEERAVLRCRSAIPLSTHVPPIRRAGRMGSPGFPVTGLADDGPSGQFYDPAQPGSFGRLPLK